MRSLPYSGSVPRPSDGLDGSGSWPDPLISAVRVFGAGRPEDGIDIHLECVNPAANRFRAYHVAIETDLFAKCALVVSWGRIGPPGRTRLVGSGDATTMRAMAERLLRRHAQHGCVMETEGPRLEMSTG